MSQINYRFSPTLLNKFQEYLDSEEEFEGSFNRVDEGYKLSLDEIIAKREQALLDYINKVSEGPSEAADMGTCMNEILDRIILNKKDGNPDIDIHTSPKFGYAVKDDIKVVEMPCIIAHTNTFEFAFDIDMCRKAATAFKGAIPQYHTEAILPTIYGDVLLHGYVDYIQEDRVIDLKTTKYYSFPKFNKGWQKELYPYCLIESGDMDHVSEFEYAIVLWKEKVGLPINGEFYSEVYTYNHEKTKQRLINMCTHLIEWILLHKDKITDQRIFGK